MTIGTATTVAVAGCVSESNDDGATFPSTLKTGLSYMYPQPGQVTILRIDTAEDTWPHFRPSHHYYVTENNPVDLTVEIKGLGPEVETSEPSSGAVYLGSITINEDDDIEHTGTARGFDRYRIPGGHDHGPIHLANNGDVLLADSKPWVEETLDEREAGTDTYIESNTRVRELLDHFESVDYNIVLWDGQWHIERYMKAKGLDPSTVPEVLAWGAQRSGESTTQVVAMAYASEVGETEKEEFPALAEAAHGVETASPETRGDGRILVFETTE